MRRSLILFACLMSWCDLSFAQIVVTPAEPKLGQKIELSLPAGLVGAAWQLPEGAEALVVADKWVLFPGKGGDCEVICDVPAVTRTIAALVIDPADPNNREKWTVEPVTVESSPAKQFKTVVKVTGGGPPAPLPLPEPVPGSLASKVPAEFRLRVADFFTALAELTRAGAYTSVSHFRAKQAEGVKYFKAAGKLPDLSAVNETISTRLINAVGGDDDVALDAAKRSSLAAALDSIANEFRGN